MSYQDKECYIGQSVKLGYQDKCGKWQKSVWYKRKKIKKKLNLKEI